MNLRNISHLQDGIKIDQSRYVKTMLKEYGMENENAVKTPLPKTADLLTAYDYEHVLGENDHKVYRSMIGSLLYLAVCTRPDMLFSVSALARQLHTPTLRHMSLIKRIFRYVAGTVNYGLKYSRSVKQSCRSLVANVNADKADVKRLRSQPLVG